jgi:hypothetical protein
MAFLPPLLPGCMIAWFDESSDRPHYALVVTSSSDPGRAGWFDATIIQEMRVKKLTLWWGDKGTRWRVLHGA